MTTQILQYAPGSMAAHDQLVEALARYESAETQLRQATDLCGRGPSEPALAFARQRVATYQQTMRAAVGDLARSIAVNNSMQPATALGRLTNEIEQGGAA